MNYTIGVDIGTSGTKSVLFDEKGNVIASASAEYPISLRMVMPNKILKTGITHQFLQSGKL